MTQSSPQEKLKTGFIVFLWKTGPIRKRLCEARLREPDRPLGSGRSKEPNMDSRLWDSKRKEIPMLWPEERWSLCPLHSSITAPVFCHFLSPFSQKRCEQDIYKHLSIEWIHSWRLLPPAQPLGLALLSFSCYLPAHHGRQSPHCGACLSWCHPPVPHALLPLNPLSSGDWLHICHCPFAASPTPHLSTPHSLLWLCSPDVLLFCFCATESCLLEAMAYDHCAAICEPLHNPLLLSHQVCLCLAGSACTCGATGPGPIPLSSSPCPLCAISHFCEIQATVKLLCRDTSLNELQIVLAAGLMILIGLILGSYGCVLTTIF